MISGPGQRERALGGISDTAMMVWNAEGAKGLSISPDVYATLVSRVH